MLLHYYYHGRYYLLIVFLFSYSFCYITCIRCLQKIQHFVFVCVQSQQLPLSLRCQTLLLSKQEVELFRIGDSYSVLSFSRVRQYETIKIRVNIELIMTTCIHRHVCTHKDIYLRYCYVTIMSFWMPRQKVVPYNTLIQKVNDIHRGIIVFFLFSTIRDL